MFLQYNINWTDVKRNKNVDKGRGKKLGQLITTFEIHPKKNP